MTTSSATSDVIAAAHEVASVAGYEHTPYNIVASLLHYDFGYTRADAHAAIFEAIMAGTASLSLTRVRSIDTKDMLCIAVTEEQK